MPPSSLDFASFDFDVIAGPSTRRKEPDEAPREQDVAPQPAATQPAASRTR